MSKFEPETGTAEPVSNAVETRHVGSFAPRILTWFDHAGRKNLPWQREPGPYRVWVSEIMLQQTQVATVIPYYEAFIERFPDIASLAAAPIDEVLHLWSGLGYYARARNLHRAANRIVEECGGRFPESIEAVQQLPGIGRSTAGAILVLALGQRHPILDGNVKRVLTRYFAIEGFPGEQRVARQLWSIAEDCTPSERTRDYTQAIMDLGATVCTRTNPACLLCPLADDCRARERGIVEQLPTPRPARVRRKRVSYVVVATQRDGSILLEQRPPSGIWGGLWSFPEFDDLTLARAWIATTLSGPSVARQTDAPHHHAFTHYDLDLHPLAVRCAGFTESVAERERYRWYDPQEPARIGLAAPVAELIRRRAAQR